jgi:hypothetical protein
MSFVVALYPRLPIIAPRAINTPLIISLVAGTSW